MLSTHKLAIARCERFTQAASDFDLRAIVGQTDPDHAHTMSEGNMYASLTGIMQTNVSELLDLVAAQADLIDQQRAQVDELNAAIDQALTQLDGIMAGLH